MESAVDSPWLAGFARSVEDARRAHDRGLLRMRERHLDHFDAEERRIRIVARRQLPTQPGSSLSGAHAATSRRRRCRRCPGPSDRRRTVCVCEPRHVCTLPMYFGCAMSVMSKMRMPRTRSLLTVSGTPCAAAVEAARESFSRDEEQILVDRDVALRRRAVVRRLERRVRADSRCPRSDSRVVALNDVVAREREIGVRHAHELRRRRRVRDEAQIPDRLAARPSRPRFRPTRGSGLGAAADMFAVGDGAAPDIEALECEHAEPTQHGSE